jgi:tRNA(Arg) A34 adenosine deaminase TadA
MSPEELMRMAIAKTREGMAAGNSPFGCAIEQNGKVIAEAHNTVLTTIDSTAHAEVNAIRVGCKHIGKYFLEGGIVATTCEPCPMCMSALHWARVDTVYFGATVQDAADCGFNELYIDAQQILSMGKSKVKLIGGILSDECKQLFNDYSSSPTAKKY